MPWILVAVGGAVGALSRYGLDRAVISIIGPTVLGIFLINITGSFLLGLFVALSEERTGWPVETRMLVAVGFLGSYTTFSTLTVASIQQVIGGDVTRAILNIGGSIAIGLLAAFAGILVGRAL
jgi:CrcB protein